MKRADIERIVFTAVGELNATLPDSKHVPTEGGTRLLGEGGRLDSIGLVDLILSVEQKVQDTAGIGITVADEKAFSRKQSPFLTLDTLTDYVTALVQGTDG
ncbi:MAG: acyl carrier protein [Planctomycetes bacterium]|jgi:acyl carrier protein|nr:acyl carrier protein [Planctomycetota bacterium]